MGFQHTEVSRTTASLQYGLMITLPDSIIIFWSYQHTVIYLNIGQFNLLSEHSLWTLILDMFLCPYNYTIIHILTPATMYRHNPFLDPDTTVNKRQRTILTRYTLLRTCIHILLFVFADLLSGSSNFQLLSVWVERGFFLFFLLIYFVSFLFLSFLSFIFFLDFFSLLFCDFCLFLRV